MARHRGGGALITTESAVVDVRRPDAELDGFSDVAVRDGETPITARLGAKTVLGQGETLEGSWVPVHLAGRVREV